MNTADVNKPVPSIEGHSSHIFRAVAHREVEERDCPEEEPQADQCGPEEDFDEWLVHRAPEEPPEPGDEDISLRESNELFIRGMLAFERPGSYAEQRARLLRSRQLRLRDRQVRIAEARRASRRLAMVRARLHADRAQPRSRATRQKGTRRATAARNAAGDGGPAPAPAPLVTLQTLNLPCWTVTCPEVGGG